MAALTPALTPALTAGEREYHMAVMAVADAWVPAAGGKEVPTTCRNGRRVLYCYNPRRQAHAYLDLGTDLLIESDDDLRACGLL